MKCDVEIKTELGDSESKVLYKLLGEITAEMRQDCSMTTEESKQLQKMYHDMGKALGGVG